MKIASNPYQKFYSVAYSNRAKTNANMEGVRLVREQLSDVPYSTTKKVLDIACGIGLLGRSISSHVWGFDMNAQAIKRALKNGVHATRGDAEDRWKYPSNTFDIVLASHIIEHVRNPDQLITEAKRVLKIHGILIIITPNLAAWFNRVLIAFGIQPFFTEVSTIDKTLGLAFAKRFFHDPQPVGHLRVFTVGALTDILTLHGFSVIHKKGMEFGAFPKVIRVVDRWISHVTPLASSIIVIAQKNRD